MLTTRIIRLLIVDDHEMVRTSISFFIANCDDITIVGEAANGDQALQLCAELQPDVVLLDLNIPLVNGLNVATIIRDLYPVIRVVVLTYSNSEDDIAKAIAAGVKSYLLKDVTASEIAHAIRQAVR